MYVLQLLSFDTDSKFEICFQSGCEAASIISFDCNN